MKSPLGIQLPEMNARDRLFTWSNFISLTRALIALPIIWFHHANGGQVNLAVTLLVVYGLASDYLDGWLARKTGNVTEVGKTLDPVADKLAAFPLLFYAIHLGWIPLWFLVTVLVRDLIIMAGSLHVRRTKGEVPGVVFTGKVSINALALYWIVGFFAPEAVEAHRVVMVISLFWMAVSLFDYLHHFRLLTYSDEVAVPAEREAGP